MYLVMVEHANAAGRRMTASMFTLAREAGFSVRAVRNAVRHLEAEKWVRCTHASKGGFVSDGRPAPTSTYCVLTLADPPPDPLTESKRRAILFPEKRLDRFRRVNGARHDVPTRCPAGNADKHCPA